MKEEIFKGLNGRPLNLYIEDGAKEPIAIVQIIHGNHEHIGLYDAFTDTLRANGIIACGIDNRTFGKSAGLAEDDADRLFEDIVEDNIKLAYELRNRYGLPLFLYGHGFGATIVQRIIELISDDVDGAVMSGAISARNYVGSIIALRSKWNKSELGDNYLEKRYMKRIVGRCGREDEYSWLSNDGAYRARFAADEMTKTINPIGFYYRLRRSLKHVSSRANLSGIRKDLPILIAVGSSDPLGRYGRNIMRMAEAYEKSALNNVKIRVYRGERHVLAQVNSPEFIRDILDLIDSALNSNA